MRAIVIDAFGGVEQLRLAEAPDPSAGSGEVLIQVAAAGVGPWDIKQRRGQLGPVPFPYVLGWEVAGTVTATGPGVTGFQPGDEVYAYCYPGGGYAERVAVPAQSVARKPDALGFAAAAAVPVTALTAHQALTDELHLRPGEQMLITGAAGGVGTFAVQIAAALGSRVIGTASPRNAAYLHDLGATAVVDYGQDDWPRHVRDLAAGGVDLALDCVGGATLAGAVAATRDGGSIVTIVDPQPPATPRDIALHYVVGAPDGQRLATLTGWFDTGRLSVTLQEVLPLSDVRRAHEQIATGHTRGKLVLDVSLPAGYGELR